MVRALILLILTISCSQVATWDADQLALALPERRQLTSSTGNTACPAGWVQKGTLSTKNDVPGSALGHSQQATIQDCEALCNANPSCNSFMYGGGSISDTLCEIAAETEGTNNWGSYYRFCTRVEATTYVMAPDAEVCPSGTSVITTVEECQIAFDAVKDTYEYVAGRTIQSDSWTDVPYGCSVQVDYDDTPHLGTLASSDNGRLVTGEFRNICKVQCVMAPEAEVCPSGTAVITTVEECQIAFDAVKDVYGYVPLRTMQSAAWNGVPYGCSVQVDYDDAPHLNTDTNTDNHRLVTGEFRNICKVDFSVVQLSAGTNCNAGYEIESLAQCEAAAAELGFSDVTAEAHAWLDEEAPKCYFNTGYNELYWNTAAVGGAHMDNHIAICYSSEETTETPAYCATFTCPDSMKHKAGYELIVGETEDVCCDLKICSDFVCTDQDGQHITGATTTAGYTFDTCCTCNYGSKLFYGAVAVGDYIVNGLSGDGTPTMSITLPIPSDITVTELTWYQGDGTGDYTPTNVNSWEVVDVNPCKKHYTYTKTIPTFFGDGAKWSIEGNSIFATITMQGTKQVTETFGSFTETYERTVRHAIGVQVGLTTTSSVTANFHIKSEPGHEYFFVTGIVDNFAADGSEVTLTLVLKSEPCVKESASLVQGGDYVVAANTDIAFGDASLDANDMCQQEVTFKFKPKTCFTTSQNFELQFTDRTDHTFSVEMEVMIECASFLDDLPILATLTFHSSQDTLTTEQTTFQLGQEVYALLDTSTLVPLTNIEIQKVVVVQTGYNGADKSTQLKPVEDTIYRYTDIYPAPGQGADTAMMMWDLESTHFTVSASGATAKTMVDFQVTYDSGYTFRRRLEVGTKLANPQLTPRELLDAKSSGMFAPQFGEHGRRVLDIAPNSNDPALEEKEFGYADEMLGEFTIVDDESTVGVSDVDSSPRSFSNYILAGIVAAMTLVAYYQYQGKNEEEKKLLNVYQMEEDVF